MTQVVDILLLLNRLVVHVIHSTMTLIYRQLHLTAQSIQLNLCRMAQHILVVI
jgi:hypothetical protein